MYLCIHHVCSFLLLSLAVGFLAFALFSHSPLNFLTVEFSLASSVIIFSSALGAFQIPCSPVRPSSRTCSTPLTSNRLG